MVDAAYSFQRTRLPAGDSYPVKRSEVDALIEGMPELDLDRLVFWRLGAGERATYFAYTGWRGTRPVADGVDWLPLCSVSWFGWDARRDPYARPFSAHLWIYAVPSARRAELRPLMLDQVLPDALAWARAVATGPETGRTERRKYVHGLADGVPRRAEC